MKSIENIHEITKAMEMIAAFRFKKAENRFSKSKKFLIEMETLVSNLSTSAGNLTHPLFEKREVRKKTLVLMTGDKGLCGAYNTNLIKSAQIWLKENAGFQTSVVPAGKVGNEFFKKRHIDFPLSYAERGLVEAAFAKKITEDLKQLFLSGKTDQIDILYNSFRVGGTGQNKIETFLSLSYLKKEDARDMGAEYIYEPDFETVFISLLNRYLEGKIYITLLESLVSEFAARMVAMKKATENGEEVLDALKLLRNKTRQATITRELSEIVGGASVLV